MNELKHYTRTLTLRGLVQGVGYRPFVRGEAIARGVTGSVQNIGGGVRVRAFGTKEALDDLVGCLLSSPPLGTVYLNTEIGDLTEVAPAERPAAFTIAESDVGDLLSVVSPDIAPCAECERELNDPTSRRYRYPFQSCAICGPRYSIQTALPYDRIDTTMKEFPLCDACEREYHDPVDRRSYAQTIACKDCGPRLSFYPAGAAAPVTGDDAAIEAALAALRSGEIVAVKNNGGFHLACLADDAAAIRTLRAIKGREEKPFALLFADLAAVEAVAKVSETEAALLSSTARPIVLLEPKGTTFPPEASGESLLIGAMLPSTPLQMLIAEAGVLVMTSANRSGEPIFTEFAPLAEWLGGRAAILTHDRPIVTPQDDSLLFVENGKPCFLRRSRGYAPLPIGIDPSANAPTVAMGGDLKAVFALQKDGQVYLSQHTGDLADLPIRRVWEDLQTHLSKLLGITPVRAVCDLHPGYFSRAAAERAATVCGLPVAYVQHHHAHIASVMAEHRLSRVLGFAFDGTGYGEDGIVWGGELLLCEGSEYRRMAHLLPLPMPRGDEGAKDALRLARFHLAGAGALPETPEETTVTAAVKAGVGIPTSSVGRLFDAASAILGICRKNTYEGRAAILLENTATLWKGDPAPLPLPLEGEIWRSDLLLLALREGVRKGAPVGALALGFHQAVANAVCEAATVFAKVCDCTDVALSGGVFANRLLLRLCRERLEAAGLTVYRNEKVPVGDGGIALGQAYIAAQRE
ncbi:MAG: carbamoyltransferase HypF [Clostridia bacterium]|nr:carbamoyltransferase HypF [Clostridia bacterium]